MIPENGAQSYRDDGRLADKGERKFHDFARASKAASSRGGSP